MNTFLYNPAQKSKKELLAEFVIRRQAYDEIMQDLETSSLRHPEQNYLIVGQRGMGKTTLLLRLKYGIEDSKKIKGRLIPVAFTEEQYQIIELVHLWEYIAEYLEDHHGFVGIYRELLQQVDQGANEEKAFEILEKALKKEKKQLVLLIDNISALFDKLDLQETHRLRELLQTKNTIRVIGGSTSYMGALLDYHQPFYEFFKIIRLEGLSKEESTSLLLNLGELSGEKKKITQIIKEAPGRIETLRILTGGVPRTMSILFGIFIDHEHERALKDLYKILDLVTPLYKHRMDDLPVQQQKIVDAVARHWEPITVKELNLKTRLPSKILSAQLNQLEKDQVVIKNDTDTKNKTYLIRERFWNIWYLMRYGRRDDREKIIWLVNFLESWLSSDDIRKRIESFVEKVNKHDIDPEQLTFLGKVYASLKSMPASSKLKLKSVEREIKKEIKLSDEEWYAIVKEEFDQKNYFEAFKHLHYFTDFNNPSSDWLLSFNRPDALKNISERHKELYHEDNWPKFIQGYNILIISYLLTRGLTSRSRSFEDAPIYLKHFLEAHLAWEYYIEPLFEPTSMSFILTLMIIEILISKGLYNAVQKVVEEASFSADGQQFFLKDQWKPFYLAIKYLYQPEELRKQPSELAIPAFDLVARLTGKKK